MSFIASTLTGFFLFLFGVPLALGFARALGMYTVIEERKVKVFSLFGEVKGTIREPGLHFLWGKLGLQAILIPFFGKVSSTSGWTKSTCAASR